jgi:hypothetical protein
MQWLCKKQLLFQKKHKTLKATLLFCKLLLISNLQSMAQAFDLGSWNILQVKYTYNKRWSVFAEGQLRSLAFYNDFHYYEYKGAIQYKLDPQLQLSIGAGSYQTYKEGGDFLLPKNNDELRIWPQLLLQQSIGKFNIEQRYRAEIRFTVAGYRNRFRYRLGLSYPFGNSKKGYKAFLLTANNELFFTDREPYFERNRSSISISYRLSKTLNWQLGYLHQFDYKLDDEIGRDFLQIACIIDLYH